MYQLIHNYHVAVPTAFDKNEELNVQATIDHILFLQHEGVKSVLVCGSTGEQHSLTLQEKLELVSALEKEDRFSTEFEIIFGVASIRQKEAVQLAQVINQKENIAAILLGFPPYILPNQSEAICYVEAITKQIDKPVILYNNPKRTGFNLELETLNKLCQIPHVIGLKEAGDKTRLKKMAPDLIIYTGGEVNLAESIRLGISRLSSIGGNIYPKEINQWFQSLLAGNQEEFKYQKELDDLYSERTLAKLKEKIEQNENIEMGKPRSPLGNK